MARTDPQVGAARADVLAARDEVIAAREALRRELTGLEASARDAVDLKAKVKRSPEKAVAVAGGIGFVLLGGPKKLLGGAKRAVFGRGKPYPSALLPEEVDRVVRSLGSDGAKVQGVLEREFAAYLKEKRKSDKPWWRGALVGSILLPLANAAAKDAVKRAAAGEPVLPWRPRRPDLAESPDRPDRGV